MLLSHKIQCSRTGSGLRLPHPRQHIALDHVGDLAVELIEPSVQDEQGLPGRGHEVLAEGAAAHHRPVTGAPRPFVRLDGLFQALDHLHLAAVQLHEQHVGLAPGASEHVVLVGLSEGALEGQVGDVQVGVDVKGLPDLASLRDSLDAHEAVAVVHGHEVAAVRGHVGRSGDVAVQAHHAVRHAVYDDLRLRGARRVRAAIDKVVAAQVGVSRRLGDAVNVPQADVLHVGHCLQVDLVQDRLISVKDEAKSVGGFVRDNTKD